jgi:hypothetical protein
MLDHYSGIRLDAKRKALDGVEEARDRQTAIDANAEKPLVATETPQ